MRGKPSNLESLRNLTGKKPSGSSLKLASRKSIGLSKADTKKRLLMIATIFDRSPSLTFRELLI